MLGRGRGAEERDPLAGDRLERPRAQDRADDRHVPGRRAARSARRELGVGRVRLGHRDDHEIRDAGAVRVQVAGRHLDGLRGRRDEHAAVGLDRRKRGAAPVEEHELRVERGGDRRRPSSTFETATAPARPPPQRRQPTVGTPATSAVSRWSDAAWRPSRESSRSASTSGGTSTVSGSGGPPRPIATTTTRLDAASRRAR